MKKISVYFGIIAAAALTLVSCAKEIDNPNIVEEPTIEEGIPFQIVANPVTKTTIAGLQTAWAADDQINLFHAVAGSTTYVDDSIFSIAAGDLASGTFTGTVKSPVPASGNTYDWYAIYPYSEYTTSVHNTSGRYYIGSRSDEVQTQTGNSSTAHLAGPNYPLFGKATGVAYDATPSITLSPIASFIEIKVTNKNDNPLTVTTITFTAPDGSEIVGSYIIDFEASPLTITKYSTYASDAATLNITGGTPIAKDAYATFYLAVKPFSTTSGDDIKVSVNGHEKTIHTTKDFTFQAGKMKTVNFDYTYADLPQPSGKNGYYRVDDLSWLAAGDHVVIAAAGYNKALSTSQNPNNRGSVTITKGTDETFGTLTTNDDVQEFVLETGTETGTFAFKAYNGDSANKYIYAASSSSNYLKSQATKDANASFAIVISDGKATMTAQGTNTRNLLKYNDASDLFSCYSSGQKDVAIYKKYVDLLTAKTVTKLKDVTGIPAAGVSAEVVEDVYELANATDSDITVTCDGTIVTDADASDGDIVFDVAENNGAARAGWIKIAVAGGNTVQISVSQLAGAKVYTITWNSTNNSEGVSSYTKSWEVTADGLTCIMNNWNNNNNGWSLVKCGRKNNASVATIVTKTAIPEAIKTVTLTIDALTAEKINSIKLYVSSTTTFGDAEGSFTKATGNQSVVISSPAANKYYMIEVDCASGDSNGLFTLSKLTFSDN